MTTLVDAATSVADVTDAVAVVSDVAAWDDASVDLKGNRRRYTIALTDHATGAAVDPVALTLTILRPDGVTVSLAYSATVLRDSAGNYHADLDHDLAGVWRWRWAASTPGVVEKTVSGEFFLEPWSF